MNETEWSGVGGGLRAEYGGWGIGGGETDDKYEFTVPWPELWIFIQCSVLFVELTSLLFNVRTYEYLDRFLKGHF